MSQERKTMAKEKENEKVVERVFIKAYQNGFEVGYEETVDVWNGPAPKCYVFNTWKEVVNHLNSNALVTKDGR